MVTFLCIILALLTFLMGMAILLQEPKQSGLSGSFGMGGDQMLGAGTPNALSKFTGWLATGFLALCLVIGLLSESEKERTGIQPRADDTVGAPAEVTPGPDDAGTGATPPPAPGGGG